MRRFFNVISISNGILTLSLSYSGDSYTSTAFSVFSTLPSESNPFGNPTFNMTYSTNGINWIKYLATEYNSSTYVVYNLAVAGSTIDNNITNFRPNYRSFVEQVEQTYLPYLSPSGAYVLEGSVTWNPAETTTTVWFGINDIVTTYQEYNTAVARVSLYARMMQSYWSAVETLYKSGMKNFIIMTVPAIDYQLAYSDQQLTLLHAAITDYNAVLKSSAESFAAMHRDDTKLEVVDMYLAVWYIVDNYKSFGFEVQRAFCEAYADGVPFPDTWYADCEYPADDYVYINSAHVTTDVHRQFAQIIATKLEDIGVPIGGDADKAREFASEIFNSSRKIKNLEAADNFELFTSAQATASTSLLTAMSIPVVTVSLSKPYGMVYIGS